MGSLETDRYFPLKVQSSVFIRPFKVSDANALLNCVDNNRDTFKLYLPWVPMMKEVSDEEDFLTNVSLVQENNATGLHCGIFQTVCSGEEEVLGSVSLRTINWPTKTAQIGYFLSAEKQGTGICTMSCKKLIEYGQAIGIERFEIHVGTNNKKSAAVAQRLGFQKLKGEIKGAEIVNNDVVDHSVYLFVTTQQ